VISDLDQKGVTGTTIPARAANSVGI